MNNKKYFYGIGGVWGISVFRQVTESVRTTHQQSSDSLLTLDNVEKTAFSRAGWTDEQINDKYADVQITNLALVVGAMKALNINQVWALQVNNTSGVLIDPAYWTRADSKP